MSRQSGRRTGVQSKRVTRRPKNVTRGAELGHLGVAATGKSLDCKLHVGPRAPSTRRVHRTRHSIERRGVADVHASNRRTVMRALVTGATGFIGANVARALLEHGRSVRVLARASSDRGNLEGLDVDVAEGDLRDPSATRAAVRGCDEVYHVAAEYTFWARRPEEIFESNVAGTRNVLEACLRHGVGRVVYTSTVGTMGLGGDAARGTPRDEQSPLAEGQFSGHYKRSKLEAERVALAYVDRGLPLVVVNPSAPVGPWDRKPTPTGRIVVDFMRGAMPAFLDTGLNVVDVRDVAVGHVLAAEKGRVGERYILGNRNLSLAEILGVLSELSGRKAPTTRIPYALAYLVGLASTTVADRLTRRAPRVPIEAVKMAKFHMYFSADKAVRSLGLPQTPPERAFQDALAWFSARGYLDSRNGRGPWRSRSSKP
jgi:dihydroflavonol-4-reductase